MCLIAVGFKGSGPSKVYAKKKKIREKSELDFYFLSTRLSCSLLRLSAEIDQEHVRRIEGVQIFDTLVKHFIQVCHRDVALKRFVIPCPCHHSQTAVTALTIWRVEETEVLLLQ